MTLLRRLAALAFLSAAAMSTGTAVAGMAADEVLVASPYAREMPPMQPNSAMFMTLKNNGDQAHALVKAESDVAARVELHTHIMEDGVARMREVEKIDIPAKGEAVLQSGGLHVMFLGLKRPLLSGSEVAVKLIYEDGSSTSLNVPVKPIGQGGGKGAGHDAMKCGGGKCGGGMKCGAGKCGMAMADGAKPEEPMSPVLVNLTSDDTWRAGMALHWATMAAHRGHKTTIFLNVEGVRLASTAIAHEVHSMQGKSPHDMLKDAIEAGAEIIVCRGCLKRSGLSEDSLMDGVKLGSPDLTMNAVFAPDTKVISW